MKTRILKPNKQGIMEAAKIIRNGGVVAFPTETVYGLGANALSEEACKKIFKAKNRPADNPLIVHISDIDEVENLTEAPNENVKKIMNQYWPGPISIILNALPHIPKAVTAGLETVAVRFPKNAIAQNLIIESGCPIAAPSANISGRPSATKTEHVLKDFNGRIDAVIAGSTCEVGLESTVIDGTTLPVKILRPGSITLEMIQKITPVELATTYKGGKALSPGMMHPHYNPEAKVILIKGMNNKELVNKINKATSTLSNYSILGLSEVLGELDLSSAKIVEQKNDVQSVGERLYSFFRECDELGIDNIVLHEVPSENLGLALMNRINKAANEVN